MNNNNSNNSKKVIATNLELGSAIQLRRQNLGQMNSSDVIVQNS